MQVFDNHKRRIEIGELLDEADDGFCSPERQRLGLSHPRSRPTQQSGYLTAKPHLTGVKPEGVGDDPERPVALHLLGASREDPGPGTEATQSSRNQSRLADPRLSLDDNHTTVAPGGIFEDRHQQGEFGLPSDQLSSDDSVSRTHEH